MALCSTDIIMKIILSVLNKPSLFSSNQCPLTIQKQEHLYGENGETHNSSRISFLIVV